MYYELVISAAADKIACHVQNVKITFAISGAINMTPTGTINKVRRRNERGHHL